MPVAVQVGVMGFSKGGFAAAIAMALEPRIPAAWLDSAPFHGLRGSFSASRIGKRFSLTRRVFSGLPPLATDHGGG